MQLCMVLETVEGWKAVTMQNLRVLIPDPQQLLDTADVLPVGVAHIAALVAGLVESQRKVRDGYRTRGPASPTAILPPEY
jgi:hypothetical protein